MCSGNIPYKKLHNHPCSLSHVKTSVVAAAAAATSPEKYPGRRAMYGSIRSCLLPCAFREASSPLDPRQKSPKEGREGELTLADRQKGFATIPDKSTPSLVQPKPPFGKPVSLPYMR
ncbi:predicted protein [Coccidioides posadasii str. Silveira]|uniref:Predicted protein n=1 Tax=Coccidioides posadasii (strain RMSCC 757 / Silveira) TaxID=443226 RepID=E9DK59_COCPS|nr:predicted protein [Coccidioides posadasii str. Silveira]